MLPDREIRVFVSSTFRDMQREREHLIKNVFPRLRKLCESRDVTWHEVDLRWGITDAEFERGEVSSLCLRELDRCRPFFIGLLGDAHGTVAEEEMLHCLSDPAGAAHAFFYFRRPASAESESLVTLKERIRSSWRDGVLPTKPRDGYATPEVLGRAIRRDFRCVINDLFPADAAPDPIDRARCEHEAIAQKHRVGHVVRKRLFEQLDASASPLVITGEAGIGKSALLANWLAHHRERHPDDFTLLHAYESTDDAAIVRRILLELNRAFFRGSREVPVDREKVLHELPKWIAEVPATSRVVLVLDGLEAGFEWLPLEFPSNCRVIASTRPGPALDAVRRRQWQELALEPLTEAERMELIRTFLRPYGKRLDKTRRRRIAAAAQTANPLFLRALLDELRQFGDYSRLDERIERCLSAAGPRELYDAVLERWENDYSAGRDLVRRALVLIRSARRGLTEAELVELLGDDSSRLPDLFWSPLFLAMESSLTRRSGVLTFAHDYVGKAVRHRYETAAHSRLVEYFRGKLLTPRAIDELPWQLIAMQAWEPLFKLLSRVDFAAAAVQRDFSDIRTCWIALEEHSPFRRDDAYRGMIAHPEDHAPATLMAIGRLIQDTDAVVTLFKEAALESHRIGDRHAVVDCLGRLAATQVGVRLTDAIALYQKQEKIAREIGHYKGLQDALKGRAYIHQLEENPYEEMEVLAEREAICREYDDWDGLQDVLGERGCLLQAMDKFDAALLLHAEEERICRMFGWRHALASCLHNQAVALYRSGREEAAWSRFDEAEALYRELRLPAGILMCRTARGQQAANEGRPAEALEIFDELLAIAEASGEAHLVADCLMRRAHLLLTLGRKNEALKMATRAYDIASQQSLKGQAREAMALLVSCL
jgi:tetratricopeptide (TPR) repeat protein